MKKIYYSINQKALMVMKRTYVSNIPNAIYNIGTSSLRAQGFKKKTLKVGFLSLMNEETRIDLLSLNVNLNRIITKDSNFIYTLHVVLWEFEFTFVRF